MKNHKRTGPIFLAVLLILLILAGLISPTYAKADGSLLYSFSQSSVGFYYNPPTLVDNYIYIGTSRCLGCSVASDNHFFKLNLDLTKAWEYSLGNKEVRGGATLDSKGNIYFVVEEGRLTGDNRNSILYLYSLDNNGAFRWSKIITPSGCGCNVGMSNPAISVDDTIYIGGSKFYAFDANGNEKWTYENNMIIMNAPIIDPNGDIYFSTSWGVISLNPNGVARWFLSTAGLLYASSPAFSTDYSKIFIGVGNKIYCLQTSTGIKVWEFTPPGMIGDFRATPAVDSNDNVYIGTKADNSSVFYAIKSDGSGLLWSNAIGADLYSSPALGNDNTLYVGSEYSSGKRLHALDMTTGNTKWSSSALGADATWSSPAITNTGTLYIASMDYMGSGGGVYAFRTDSTGLLPNAGSARFHGGNENTGRRISVTCTTTVSPASYSHSASSNTGTITVTPSSSSCAWAATSNASWITITSGASLTGTGTVAYSVTANTGAARTGTITAGGQTITITQLAWTYSNSIGTRNTIKISDVSGLLSSSGASITVSAWDVDGRPLSPTTTSFTLQNRGTTSIEGEVLAARFTGTPMLYALSADSSKYIITNVKKSSDPPLNVPSGATNGTTNFAANSIGSLNTLKISDVSGLLPSSGASITVSAWNENGNALSPTTTSFTLLNRGTTSIDGTALKARFSGTPLSYEFTVDSSKYVITNVKRSSDSLINIPYAYISGTTNFVANSIGDRNTLKISDVSGLLPSSGASITVSAWNENGNALSPTTTSFTLLNRGTTSIDGTTLRARFTTGTPMSYEFTVPSSKYIITNVKRSTEGTINIPAVYTSGTTTYASNDISASSSIKITDVSGSLSTPASITVAAWNAAGNEIHTSAAPLTLNSYGTTTITGNELIASFPAAVLYEFTIGSSKYLVTYVTSNTDGTLKIPSVYWYGVAGGI